MPEIKIQHVVSVSSEDKHYPAENLLKNDGFKKWKCLAGEKQAVVVFQFEKAVAIKQIDIGNEGSAFIEVLVGKSTSADDDYEVILVASSFMNPTESRANQNPNRVRIFNSDQLSQAVTDKKWDRVKVICTQPFNKSVQYGLSFIKFHSSPASASADISGGVANKTESKPEASLGAFKLKSEEPPSLIRAGSLFEKSKLGTEPSPSITSPATIRAASKMAEQMTSMASTVTQQERSANSDESKVKDNSKEIKESSASKNEDKEKSKEANEKFVKKNESKNKSKKGNEPSADSPPPTKKSRTEETASEKSQPFERLMRGVVFVLSGFQNPERSELRDAALEMGATYRPDWGKGCTHLICAFEGTPKYTQVSGHGYIVKKSWITDCHAQKKLLPWRKYRLGRAATPAIDKSDTDEDTDDQKPATEADKKQKPRDIAGQVEAKASNKKTETESKGTSSAASEPPESKPSTSRAKQSDEEWDPFDDDLGIASDCDTEEEIRRFEESRKAVKPSTSSSSNDNKSSSSVKRNSSATTSNEHDLYNASTDEEQSRDPKGSGVDDDGLPALPDFFSGKTFLLYGKLNDRRSILRYITAYNGQLMDYMSDKVKYVITDSDWDDAFDSALSENPELVFVRSPWIIACHNAQRFLPHQKFAVVAP